MKIYDFKEYVSEILLNATNTTVTDLTENEVTLLTTMRENADYKNLSTADFKTFLSTPPTSDKGDFALNCFKIAGITKSKPQEISTLYAKLLTAKIDSNEIDMFDKIAVAGPYLNFYLKKSKLLTSVLTEVNTKSNAYGEQTLGTGKTVVIDYSSPNIAKPFHVGHLRSTVIGNSLYNIYKTLGYKVIGVNHLGDWGTQFGKLIVAYKKWGKKEDIEQNGIIALNELYVRFHDEAETDDSLNELAREWFVKMQKNEDEAIELWKWFNDISMVEFNRVYKKLGINFDYFTGESFYNDKMQAVVDELKEKNLLVESDGAMVVDLEDAKMPPCLILRRDGGTLYPTRDISAALYRMNEFDFHKCLYVTASDQNLHFAQWFEVVNKMGYDWAKELTHIPFGLVSLKTGKLSTRKGNVVLMEDLIAEAVDKTLEIINTKNPTLENKEQVAQDVGIGAMIFNDLYNSRIKNVVFSWEQMLNFTGETGPYVQYTHARCCSILKKAEAQSTISFENIDFETLANDSCGELAFELAKTLMDYKEKIADVSNKNEPYLLSRQLILICQAFNKFYDNKKNILGSETELLNAIMYLITAVKQVLHNGLKILGINSPTQM